MKCGFVILNYNCYEDTIRLIEAIKNYSTISHVVIVDNCSSNDSYDVLKKYKSDKISIIKTKVNDGYSSGNNFGIKYLLKHYNIDIIAISNPDVYFEENFVSTILDDFKSHPEIAIITGVQLAPSGELASHAFWPNYTIKQYFKVKVYHLRLIYHLIKYSPDYAYSKQLLSKNSTLFEVGTVEGSLFFIRSHDLINIDYFDEHVAFYNEEDILAKKINKIGKKISVDPNVKYIHYGGSTTKRIFSNPIKAMHSYNSSIYYFNTYLSENSFLRLINIVLCGIIRVEDFLVWKIKSLFKKYFNSVATQNHS